MVITQNKSIGASGVIINPPRAYINVKLIATTLQKPTFSSKSRVARRKTAKLIKTERIMAARWIEKFDTPNKVVILIRYAANGGWSKYDNAGCLL